MSDDLDFVSLVNKLTPANRGERRLIDRYRDFREVFFTTDAGRRVLDDILYLGWVTRPLPGPTEMIQKYEGMRRLALHIAGITMVEPPAEPVARRAADDGVPANKRWIED